MNARCCCCSLVAWKVYNWGCSFVLSVPTLKDGGQVHLLRTAYNFELNPVTFSQLVIFCSLSNKLKTLSRSNHPDFIKTSPFISNMSDKRKNFQQHNRDSTHYSAFHSFHASNTSMHWGVQGRGFSSHERTFHFFLFNLAIKLVFHHMCPF